MDSEHATVSPLDDGRPAPWLPIPSRAISVVEHPCIIKNVDKGIASLGGPVKLSKGLRLKLEPRRNADGESELPKLISASLRPDDPFAKRLLSTPVPTSNLLLKVTVPKRTGRKRKRGSSGPFLAVHDVEKRPAPEPTKNAYVDAAAIFRSLQDNASKYAVSVAGVIDETHRFRNLPDIQYASSTSATMANIRDSLMPLDYNRLKNFNLNTAPGADLTKDVGPPAEFLQMLVAFNYRYQQNPHVKYTDDDRGEVNLQRSLAYSGYTIIKSTAETVPMRPKPNLPPETSLTPYLQALIANIRAELERRPIITRHMLFNRLGWDKRDRMRQAAVYCGYFFESGPWREALVKWGLDPRKNPAYRKYQTVSFLSYLKTGRPKHWAGYDKHIRHLTRMSTKELETQHTFDGVNVSHTGNLFQFCDITDPIIRRILDTEDIRTTCAPTFQGWYHVGTWAKATVILKDKMNKILGGETPDNSIYERVASWPENWDDKEIYKTYKEEVYNKQIHIKKAKEHAVMHSVRWAARNPKYAFEKLEALAAQGAEQEEAANPEEEEFEVPEDMTEIPDTAATILNEGDEDAVEEDYDEDEGDDEDEQDEDMDGIWAADEDYDSDAFDPPPEEGAEGPRPFGGLYRL